MSYERDRDRLTRGVGAIAALDAGNGARARYRQRRAKLLAARDRQLAQLTYRPGGGMGPGLGMVSLTPTKSVTITGGSGDVRQPSGQPTGPQPTGGAGGSTRPTRLWGGAGTALQQPTYVSQNGNRYVVLPNAPGSYTRMTPMGPVVVTPPATSVTPPTTSGGSGGGGSSTTGGGSGGGGSGGGGSGGGGGGSTYPGMEPPAVPDIPEDVAEVAKPTMDLKKLALIAGVLVGAWWLFGRDDKSSSSGGSP